MQRYIQLVLLARLKRPWWRVFTEACLTSTITINHCFWLCIVAWVFLGRQRRRFRYQKQRWRLRSYQFSRTPFVVYKVIIFLRQMFMQLLRSMIKRLCCMTKLFLVFVFSSRYFSRFIQSVSCVPAWVASELGVTLRTSRRVTTWFVVKVSLAASKSSCTQAKVTFSGSHFFLSVVFKIIILTLPNDSLNLLLARKLWNLLIYQLLNFVIREFDHFFLLFWRRFSRFICKGFRVYNCCQIFIRWWLMPHLFLWPWSKTIGNGWQRKQ